MANKRRRERRHLTDEEVAALRQMLHGRRPSQIGAYAALIAAIATAFSAFMASVLAVWDRIASP